jgi:hypothetical protein
VIREDEFKSVLAEFLREADVPQSVKDEVERIQMLMATPGEWEAAKHMPPDTQPDTMEETPGSE